MYVIKIDSNKTKYTEITNILELIPTSIINNQEYEISKNTNIILEICKILQSNLLKLNKIGIKNKDITIWLYCEYEGQCNMEFSAKELLLLSSLNIDFCISCWEK